MFQFFILRQSVRAALDPDPQRIVEIVRMHYSEYNRTILQKFYQLGLDNFSFVPSWDHPSITPDVFCILSRKKSTQDACNECINNVKKQLGNNLYLEMNAVDLQNPLNSLMDWTPASEKVKNGLDKRTEEPRSLLFL